MEDIKSLSIGNHIYQLPHVLMCHIFCLLNELLGLVPAKYMENNNNMSYQINTYKCTSGQLSDTCDWLLNEITDTNAYTLKGKV